MELCDWKQTSGSEGIHITASQRCRFLFHVGFAILETLGIILYMNNHYE